MPLTLFTSPKPFTNPHIATIQRNAIRNWLSLEGVRVLLLGDEPGLEEVATAFDVPLLKDVQRNAWGTPLIPSLFALARRYSDSPLLAYVNADMLFLPDFVQAAAQVAAQTENFLLVGQRWDLDVTEPLDFSPAWETRLRQRVQAEGRLHPPAGSDYFVFPRQAFGEMPDFAIGRAGWDNWMIYRARTLGWPVVDGTSSILAIHQNHDYSHLPGGKPHYQLEESRLNMRFAGGERHMYTLFETSHRLVAGELRPIPPNLPRLLRRVEFALLPRAGKAQGLRRVLLRHVRRLRRKITLDA